MKFFARIITWGFFIPFFSWAVAYGQFRADPTDDFSFLMSRSGPSADYRLMSETDVRQVLVEHLDLFPRAKGAELAEHLLRLCQTYRFDPAFILSVMQVESGFRVKVASPAGAIGLMQLMPSTAQAVALRFGIPYKGARSLEDPFTNISIGVAYLAYLREKYRGDSPYYHVAAYNMGPARMDLLRSQKSFKPASTRDYYLKIRDGVPKFRFYRTSVTG